MESAYLTEKFAASESNISLFICFILRVYINCKQAMKIAILHPSYEDSTAPFKDFDSPAVPDRYLPGHDYTDFQIRKTTAIRQVAEIARMNFDVIVNLCDAAWEEDRPGIEVVQALERLGVAFTGAGSSFYDPSREAMKIACYSAGIQFPPYVVAHGTSDIDAAVERLRFPMIVKHPHGYSSMGMTRNSRVSSVDQLRHEAGLMIDNYGAALVEEFIEGREFTVLVTEPRHDGEDAWALTPVEILFPEGESFKHFDLKWKTFETMITRAVDDTALARRLCEDSILIFAALGGSGFGRCDFRMNAAGEIHLLEINPNCAVFYPEVEYGSADFILAVDPAGHGGFLEHLITCALRRRDRARRPWAVWFRRGRGFGTFAARAIHCGEIVEAYEGRPHVLVSRRHVEQRWHGRRRQMFDRYAWPLAGDIHVTWSDDPDDWRPINHSCDPNTWIEGLDLVARRDVAAGEEITVDYATYCGASMAPFECDCNAPDCRRVILGTDHLLPLIRNRYAGHVSEFIRSAWRSSPPDGLPPFEVAQNGFGLGVVSRRAWRPGEIVSPIQWEPAQPDPSRLTLQTGVCSHAVPMPFELRYVNHSCAPNIHFDVDRDVLCALSAIQPDEELVAFYPATEWEMADQITCHCDAPDCLGVIQGAAHTPRGVLARHTLSSTVRKLLA